MTQLSLFDEPVASVQPHARSLRVLAELIHQGNRHGRSERTREVHRLGDLARLALIRHDLVARRREARAARRHEQELVAIG